MTKTSLDFEEYSIPDSQQPNNSRTSFQSSKFDEIFDDWVVQNDRQLEEGELPEPSDTCKPTYTMEQLSTPLKRWKRILKSDQSPKRCRRWGQERNTMKCRRRRVYPSDDTHPSPKYFEPWHWKGTTRRPYHYYEEEEDTSNNLFVLVVAIIVIVCVVLLIMHKDAVQEWLGIDQFFAGDLNTVKERVEGNVKDMIGSNFNDISWKYEEPRDSSGETFETAMNENDPTVIEHIKSFEEHLKKKPSKFFPSGKKSHMMQMKTDKDS